MYSRARVSARLFARNKGSKREEYLRELTRDNTQLLFNDIWKLPSKVPYRIALFLGPPPVFPFGIATGDVTVNVLRVYLRAHSGLFS